jgi:TolA-binding protein
MSGQYDEALQSLSDYLEQFPEGAFVTGASFFLAECLVREGKNDLALERYQSILKGPKSEFTESAVLKAADLSYETAAYEQALNYFILLEDIAEVKSNIAESWYGQMKCNYLLQDYDGALIPGEKLLREEKLSDEMKLEAMMITARAYNLTGEALLAKSRFREIVASSQGDAGAEAKYTLAKIAYDMNDLETSEKEVFELINQYASYDYWVASGFILLAEVYLQQGNTFQAKQTLQSIIENHEGEELKTKATNRLNEILSTEEPIVEPVENNQETLKISEDTIQLKSFREQN